MSRTVCLFILVALLASCFKKKVVRRIEGDWHCYKTLDANGLEHPANDYYHFDRESKSGTGTYTFFGADTVSGQYQILAHGVKIFISGAFTGGSGDTLNMEDIGSSSMVMTRNLHVLYFER